MDREAACSDCSVLCALCMCSDIQGPILVGNIADGGKIDVQS